MKIIAICGPKGAGKTTLARLLESSGFTRLSFAAPIKKMSAALLYHQGVSSTIAERMLNGDLKELPTPYFAGRTPRFVMQTLGTEWRELVSRTLWTEVWTEKVKRINNKIVVDDMRFTHEAGAVRKLGGNIVRISRPGCEPSGHPSELEYLNIKADLEVENSGSPTLMLEKLTREFMED